MALPGEVSESRPKPLLYYGSLEPQPERHLLRAGPLSMVYEEGDLRAIKLGEREIVRRLQCLVRDRNWGTVPASLTSVEMDIGADSFRIGYEVENRRREIDFRWRGEITGDSSGTIVFAMDGAARSTFLRNRIGSCVLHPIRECAGARCRVTLEDGRMIETSLPRSIAPRNLFPGMTSIAHEVSPGLWAELRFAGELFEMEDQRNWIDASFKTFCTPLTLPFPVEIKAGTRLQQSVTLSLIGPPPAIPVEKSNAELTLEISNQPSGALPRLGVQMASHGRPLFSSQSERLRRLNLAHLRADLKLDEPDAAAVLHLAKEQSEALAAPLELAFFLSGAAETELARLSALLQSIQPRVCRFLVFHHRERSTGERWVKLARQALGPHLVDAQLGSGTNANFCELNRGHPPIEWLDCIVYGMQPQEHACDNSSLVETLEAVAATVESAREFAGGLPIAISPVTLKKRFNPYATALEPPIGPGELPNQVDPRQLSLFGAGWTLGSIKQLAESGAASVTYYETTGWRGVLETEAGSPIPEKFPSIPGGVFPLYHVLADAGECAGAQVLRVRSSNSQFLEGLALRRDGTMRLLLANLTGAPQTARIAPLLPTQGAARIRILDESNALLAMESPGIYREKYWQDRSVKNGALRLDLLPHALVTIDVRRKRE